MPFIILTLIGLYYFVRWIAEEIYISNERDKASEKYLNSQDRN